MRFSDITKGTRAIKAITLPLGGVEHPLAVRPLNGSEEGDVEERAVAYASGKGSKAPVVGDRLYDLGRMTATLALGCVCSDDPTHPFFASAEEVLIGLDADRIALLYELHQAWQDECGARVTRMSGVEWFAKVMEVANSKADEDPLALSRPAMRRDWERTIAAQYLILLQARSSSMPDFEASTKNAEGGPPLPPSPPDAPAAS